MDISSIFTYTLNEDSVGDFLVSPVVAYFCFDSLDFNLEKNQMLEEDIFSDVKQEQKALKKKKTSNLTGTVYKLSPEQKHALRYLKRKYGRALIKEIKEYRKKTLAPYQVAKTYMERSKSLFAKDIVGMTKEDYLRWKKSAENKIANMRSNKYYDLTKEMMDLHDKSNKLDSMEDYLGVRDISEPAINKVFKKYGFYSTRFTDSDMRRIKNRLDNIDSIKKELLAKVISNHEISDEDSAKLKDAIEDLRTTKSELTSKEGSTETTVRDLKNLSRKIQEIDAPEGFKENLESILDDITDNEVKLSSKSFEQEFNNFLMREKIRADIKNKRNNKYVDDYRYNLSDVKNDLSNRKKLTVEKMAKERMSKTLTDNEKKIYELKPGAPSDSDRLSDYTLKIKEDDFFDPKYYSKDEKFRKAERKVDAEIKRFERSLESKMEPKDFQLLRKYRLISNLVTIKNAKLSDLYATKQPQENNNEQQETKEQ